MTLCECGCGTEAKQGKLTEVQVREIKLRIHNGENHRKIAYDYGVDRTTVSFIGQGKTHKNVK